LIIRKPGEGFKVLLLSSLIPTSGISHISSSFCLSSKAKNLVETAAGHSKRTLPSYEKPTASDGSF
jgi:hypothetical protein